MIGLREVWRGWPHLRESWRMVLEYSAWAVAVLWCTRTRTLMLRLDEVPDLSEVRWDLCPVTAPNLTVIVPARNEIETISPALETLLAQDYPWLQVLAVDDRSTDGTGELLDRRAEGSPDRLAVLHMQEQAEGWIAKTFAMEVAANRSRSDWLLFTDADVWFSPSILRRALAYAEMTQADHLVVAPSPVLRGWGENVVLGFLSIFATWASRPWRVADPGARWDAAGAGAFNLIRRDSWEDLGGFAPQRLAVVEDLTLGRRVKAAGLQQRLAFAPGLVLVHWATGARGLIRGMTKNLFALMNFRILPASAFVLVILVVFVLPLPGLFWWRTFVPSAIILACLAVHYRILGALTGINPRWAWAFPLGAASLMWAMIRSALVTLWQRGVHWRETFYALDELRAWNSPFQWEWEAAQARAERRRAERAMHPSRLVRFMKRRTKPASRKP